MKKMKFLVLLLVCTILFQTVLPALTIPAAAETASEELTFNGGYPYGKNMTSSSVTLVAPVEGSGTIQWYHSSSKNGEYELISGATNKEYTPNLSNKDWFPYIPSYVDVGGGNMEAVNKDPLFRAYENGTLTKEQSEYCPLNWFRCKVNGVWSKPVQLVQAVKCSCNYENCPGGTVGSGTTGLLTGLHHVHGVGEARESLYQIAAIHVKNTYPDNTTKSTANTWWYISNGYSAYTVYEKASSPDRDGGYRAFDVLGRYKHRSAKHGYDYYWLAESSANMTFDTNNYEELRLTFDDNDEYHKRVLVNAKLSANQDKLALMFDPLLGEWKMHKHNDSYYKQHYSGVISAVCKGMSFWPSSATSQNLTGIQMIGSTSTTSGIFLDTPAWNITFEEGCKPSTFWLGHNGDTMYTGSLWVDKNGAGNHDPSKYAHSYNNEPYKGAYATETTGAIDGKSNVVNSVQCNFYIDGYLGAPKVRPRACIAWTGTAGSTVTFGVAAGTITDTKAVCSKPAKCPVVIGGRPVTDRSTIDTGVAEGYVYDGEPIELWKDRTTVKSDNEYVFTDAEVKVLLDVEADLDYSFYEAEGTLDKNEVKVYPGAKLDFIPIDSRDYFLIVSVPDDNPYFTSKPPIAKPKQGQYYFDIFAKKIPVYNVFAKDKYYDGKTTIDWNWHDIQWGDETEEHKVYERDHVNTWFITEIKAEYEDPAVGNGKKIVGLMGKDGKREDINIIHWSGSDKDPNYKDDIQWKNYAPYLSPDPTGNILQVPAGAADALAPPEAEVLAPTSITLKSFPGGGTVEYAMKTPDPDWTDEQRTAELATPPSDGWKTDPEFTGLAKGREYYFYMRLTGHPGFTDDKVTSKGAAISTSNEPLKVWFKSVVSSRYYDGTPIKPDPQFIINPQIPTTTCPVEVLEFTWRQKIYDLEAKEYKYIPLDGPPKNYGDYEVDVVVKAENAEDYAIMGKTAFPFNIYRKIITRVPSTLFSADPRKYDGTNKVSTLHYNETELRAAIEKEMVGGDTTTGMEVAAAGFFSEWNKYPNTIPGEQAYEDKPYSVTILLSGPGSENYEFPFPVSGSLTATVYKAERFIFPSEDITDNGDRSITVGHPDIFGVENDYTAGTDGDIAYAISLTDECPAKNSPLWQSSPTFTGLEGNETGYFIFARITGGTNYEDAYSDSVSYISGVPHEHSWDSSHWEHSATHHWHNCLTPDCFITDDAQKDGYAEHAFTDWTVNPADGSRSRSCTVCTYVEHETSTHVHAWDTVNWGKNATHHWHNCLTPDCYITDNARKDGYGAHSFGSWNVDPVDGSRVRFCTACEYEEREASTHTHRWDRDHWETDRDAHWHNCLAPGCYITDNARKDSYGVHIFSGWIENPDDESKSRSCTVCGYEERVFRPVGQISLGTLTWSRQYHKTDTEVISNLTEPILGISAVSRGAGVTLVSMEYICSGEAKDPDKFDQSLWVKDLNPNIISSTGEGTVKVSDKYLLSGAYVYLRTMDSAGNVHYASTPKLVFDKEPPKIKIENSEVASGKAYCTPKTAKVSDNRELASVTLDGKPSKITSGTASLLLRPGEHTIVAVDTAGNRTAVTIKINNGHVNQEWSIPASCEGIGITVTTCTVCGYTSTTSISSTGHTWDTEYTVDIEPTCTEPGMESLHCTKCGAINTEKDGHREIPPNGHIIDENKWEHGASRHWQVCTVCGMRFNENSHQGSGNWLPAKGRSRLEGEVIMEHMNCAVCEAIVSQRLRPRVEENDTKLYGSVEKQIEVKPGAPEAEWNDSLLDVMEAAELSTDKLTDEKTGNAVSHKLVLSVSPFEENDKITGQKEIEEEAKKLTNDATFLYMDVSLTKHTYVEVPDEKAEIKVTTEPIKTTIQPIVVKLIIPEELRKPPEGMNRTFYLLYAHENEDNTIESGKLEANAAENGELTFSSDRFSTYAIAYVDTPEGAEPPFTPTPSAKPSDPSTPVLPPSTSTPSPSPSPDPSPESAVDHIDYIHGYNGEFRPDAYMSRAEASQIFYTLLADTPETWPGFDDVPKSAWYREPVSALAGMGIVKGVGKNLFEPKRYVTRAEFASMAARFMKLPVTGKAASFSDVPENAWYSGSIAACESAGWIAGYPDGLFHPGDLITRAQAVTIVNRMMKRSADEQALAEWEMPFSDVRRTHWAYADILEAAIAHKAWLKPDGAETWEH